MENNSIGQKLSPLLVEIESTILEHNAFVETQPHYTEDGFRAGLQIFMSVMMDKMFDVQQKSGVDFESSCKRAEKCGEEISDLVKKYTNIDTKELY